MLAPTGYGHGQLNSIVVLDNETLRMWVTYFPTDDYKALRVNVAPKLPKTEAGTLACCRIDKAIFLGPFIPDTYLCFGGQFRLWPLLISHTIKQITR
ncbi:hypothetical protein TcasGA2_TC004572 [Tribolium castaneum]|uniref:Uncharacterized protein n=1 Tax=Tribolium castaneum TaxID=7070 RepID=D6WB72_TRICA|nr:hypothetical protein TcasGA2_TC004572 [Tribolium castaneum]